MGISLTGARMRMSAARHGLATALVFLALFGYLYGPPLLSPTRDAAHRECNLATGATYRTYRLQWRTTTYRLIDRPRWVCRDLRDADRPPLDLGWWAG